LRFIVWSFLKARLQFTLDQFNGATSGGQVFGTDRNIQVGGRTVLLTRTDIRAPVALSVNTNYGHCPEPLVIAEEPDITAKVTIGGFVEKNVAYSKEEAISLKNDVNFNKWGLPCQIKTEEKRFCLPGLDPVLDGDDVAVSKEKFACSAATHEKPEIKDGCAIVKFTIPGCPTKMSNVEPITKGRNGVVPFTRFTYVKGFERKHAPYCDRVNSYDATVTLTGKSWSKVELKDFTTDKSASGGSIAIAYNQSLLDQSATYRRFSYQYRALVTFPGADGRPKLAELTSKAPTKSLEDVTLRSALTPGEGTLIITLEKSRLVSPAVK
jgi:hypothetical protein